MDFFDTIKDMQIMAKNYKEKILFLLPQSFHDYKKTMEFAKEFGDKIKGGYKILIPNFIFPEFMDRDEKTWVHACVGLLCACDKLVVSKSFCHEYTSDMKKIVKEAEKLKIKINFFLPSDTDYLFVAEKH